MGVLVPFVFAWLWAEMLEASLKTTVSHCWLPPQPNWIGRTTMYWSDVSSIIMCNEVVLWTVLLPPCPARISRYLFISPFYVQFKSMRFVQAPSLCDSCKLERHNSMRLVQFYAIRASNWSCGQRAYHQGQFVSVHLPILCPIQVYAIRAECASNIARGHCVCQHGQLVSAHMPILCDQDILAS